MYTMTIDEYLSLPYHIEMIRDTDPDNPGWVAQVRELVEKTRKVTFDCYSYVGGELVARGDASALLPD